MSESTYERIIVKTDRAQVPIRFTWKGRTYNIEHIERIWRPSQGEKEGQRLYRVRTRGQSHLLLHERGRDRWSIVTSPWRMRLGRALSSAATRLVA